MAAPKRYHSILIKVFLFVTLWNAPFCSSSATYHTVQVSTLLPSSSCNHITASNQVDSKSSSLKVVHRHGPCSNLGLNKANKPSYEQILAQDQSRVESIQARISAKQGTNDIKGSKADLPAKSGISLGSGNYIVNVGLGTPKKDLSLLFDTGSDLTWTQCRPCVKYCYKQQDPILDPSMSTSYTNISCTSPLCSQLTYTGLTQGCLASTCVYGIQYGDSSFSIGFFGKEKLTLTPTDTFSGFMFGCGQDNRGLFGRAAGLLGLGRSKISIVEQTAAIYGKYFSYCLPSSPSSTGHLTFGKTATAKSTSNAISFTPMLTIPQKSSFYGIQINGITVGGTKVPIPSTVFSNAPQIIDSGTVITRLPPTAYTALRDAFKKSMTKYPSAPPVPSLLDTCYDFSKYSSIDIPSISLSFAGPTTIDLDPKGILFAVSASQVCLAFAPNSDDTDVLIYGNVQQRAFTVVYDIAGLKIGFAPNGCP